MKVARIDGRPDHLGVFTERGLLDVTSMAESSNAAFVPTWSSALVGWDDVAPQISELAASGGPLLSETEAIVPILASAKLICVGLNYRQHALEAGAPLPTRPVIFSKLSNTLCVSGTPVVLPKVGTQYDYEVELGVVIGRPIDGPIGSSQVRKQVFGYLTANDISARDLQALSSQWLLGKSLNGFLPLTPWITTAESIDSPQDLALRTWVNGELRQDSRTSDMIFSIDEIIAFLSRYIELSPGDLILTGTPQGVVLGMKEPRPWLVPGDTVVVEVEDLGRVDTPFVASDGWEPM